MSEKLERLSKLFDLPANRRMIAELGEAHIKLVKKYSFQPMLRQHLKRLIKGSLIYGVGGFFTKFISILILPLFTFYLTPKDYGVMSMLNFLVIFLSTLFSFGLGTAIGICYFDQKDEKHKNQKINHINSRWYRLYKHPHSFYPKTAIRRKSKKVYYTLRGIHIYCSTTKHIICNLI